MKRYIKADTSDVNSMIATLQERSNNLVDSIVALIDNIPNIIAYIDEYDAVVDEDESIESEFIDDVNNVCIDLNYARRDVENIINHYRPRKDK